MRTAAAALALSATLLPWGAPAEAQGLRFGAHANLGTGLRNPYLTIDGGDANRGFGVRVWWELGLEHEGLGFLGSIDVFEGKSSQTFLDELTLEPFTIGGRYWEFNLGPVYARGGKRVKIYLGLGLNVANDTLDEDYITTFRDNDALDLGANVFLGAKLFEHVFVEGRGQIRGGGQAIVSVGLLL